MSESSLSDLQSASAGKTQRATVGRVIGNRMRKTVTVVVERRVKHPLYKKYIRRSTKLHAHDETDGCNVGDWVAIVQSRPLSKTKSWRVKEIVVRAK